LAYFPSAKRFKLARGTSQHDHFGEGLPINSEKDFFGEIVNLSIFKSDALEILL